MRGGGAGEACRVVRQVEGIAKKQGRDGSICDCFPAIAAGYEGEEGGAGACGPVISLTSIRPGAASFTTPTY